jgi:hypothetical protein
MASNSVRQVLIDDWHIDQRIEIEFNEAEL